MLKRLLLNTGSNLIMSANYMVITFIMAPIYVANLGQYDYGLREMLMAVTGYMGMLDIGMRTTISRFVSMHQARDDREALLVVYMTSAVFMGLVGLCLAGFFWLSALNWPDVITPEGLQSDKYKLFLLLAGAEIFFLFPKFVAESYFEGFQLYTIRNIINIVSTLIIAIISYIYITPENGLLLLASLVACSQVLKFIIFSAILASPTFGAILPHLDKFSMDKLKEMLSFGLKSFIQGVAYQVETASDRLVIGGILGPAAVPVYSIPASLLSMFEGIIYTITHAFMPLFSELDAKKEQEKIKQIYLLASKLLVGVIIPAAIAVVIVGGPFIEVWMKGEFQRDQIDGIIILLMIYVIIPKLNPFVSRYLTAIGRHGIFAKVAPVAALANLVFSIWLVFKLGIIGAALGSVIPVAFIMPIYLTYSCKHLQFPVMIYVRNVLLPVVSPAVIMMCITLWLRFRWNLNSYTEIISCAVIGGVIYLIAYWLFSVRAEERKLIIVWLRQRIS